MYTVTNLVTSALPTGFAADLGRGAAGDPAEMAGARENVGETTGAAVKVGDGSSPISRVYDVTWADAGLGCHSSSREVAAGLPLNARATGAWGGTGSVVTCCGRGGGGGKSTKAWLSERPATVIVIQFEYQRTGAPEYLST